MRRVSRALAQLRTDNDRILSLRRGLFHCEVVMGQLGDFACQEAMVGLHNMMLSVSQVFSTPVHRQILRCLTTLLLFVGENRRLRHGPAQIVLIRFI